MLLDELNQLSMDMDNGAFDTTDHSFPDSLSSTDTLALEFDADAFDISPSCSAPSSPHLQVTPEGHRLATDIATLSCSTGTAPAMSAAAVTASFIVCRPPPMEGVVVQKRPRSRDSQCSDTDDGESEIQSEQGHEDEDEDGHGHGHGHVVKCENVQKDEDVVVEHQLQQQQHSESEDGLSMDDEDECDDDDDMGAMSDNEGQVNNEDGVVRGGALSTTTASTEAEEEDEHDDQATTPEPDDGDDEEEEEDDEEKQTQTCNIPSPPAGATQVVMKQAHIHQQQQAAPLSVKTVAWLPARATIVHPSTVPAMITNALACAKDPNTCRQRRAEAMERFRRKKAVRCYGRRVRYQIRKRIATTRPRVNGRFAKRSDLEALTDKKASPKCDSQQHM